MKSPTKTTINCQLCGTRHSVEFTADGRVLTPRGDISSDVDQHVAMLRLGGQVTHESCIALAALVRHGCHDIYGRPLVTESDHIDLGNWRQIYTRWETNRIVEAQMRKAKRQARLQRRKAIVGTEA